MSKFADEPMDTETLERVKALGFDAARVVKGYLRLEGALHRIEEWPEHEQHYPEAERYADFRDVASHAIQGGLPGDFVGKPAEGREG